MKRIIIQVLAGVFLPATTMIAQDCPLTTWGNEKMLRVFATETLDIPPVPVSSSCIHKEFYLWTELQGVGYCTDSKHKEEVVGDKTTVTINSPLDWKGKTPVDCLPDGGNVEQKIWWFRTDTLQFKPTVSGIYALRGAATVKGTWFGDPPPVVKTVTLSAKSFFVAGMIDRIRIADGGTGDSDPATPSPAIGHEKKTPGYAKYGKVKFVADIGPEEAQFPVTWTLWKRKEGEKPQVLSGTSATQIEIDFSNKTFGPGLYTLDIECCKKCKSIRLWTVVLKVDIKKNGHIITDTTMDVIVGKKIALEGVLDPSDPTSSSKQWTIENSGEVIKKWEPEWNSAGGKKGTGGFEAHIQPLSILDQSTVSFYWVDGSFSGNSREVKYKVTVNGIACQAKVTFKVHRPTAEVTVTSDQVYLDHPDYAKPGHWMHYGLGAYGPPYGIAATRTITVPVGFTSYSGVGYFEGANWVQLGNVNRETKENGIWYQWKSAAYCLDVDYPYDCGTQDFNDSPAQQLENPGTFAYSEVKVLTETYKTWLMWRPTGPDTIPVPLIRIDWNWAGHALKTGKTWGLVSSGNSTPTLSNTTTHPEWTWTIPYDVKEVPIP